jgi:hypothetical protein
MTDDLAAAVDDLEARFEERVADLEEQVADLQDELQEERERRRDAERALAEVERDGEAWRDDHEMRHEASSNWMETLEERVVDVEDRVEEVARGEVDASELVSQSQGPTVEDLVPLHQLYLSATNLEPHEHDLTSNQEIAARLFPFIAQYATPKGDEMHLQSSKVKDVIECEIASPELAKRLDVERPNRNTIRRVMEFIGKFGKDLFEFAPASRGPRNNTTNLVVVDREAWVDYADRLSDPEDGSDGDVAATADAGAPPKARTDGGDVTSS